MTDNVLKWMRRFRKSANYALWLSLVAIVLLSLVPGDARPHTGAPGEFEHFVAYLGAGLFIAARYELLALRFIFWAGTAALSCILEFFQHFVPGRSPDPVDALASSSGVTAGIILGAILIASVRSLLQVDVNGAA